MEKTERVGLSVYLYYNRDARKVSKLGELYYHSKKMRYLVIYIDYKELDDLKIYLENQRFVKEVKISHFKEIDQNFVGNLHKSL